MQALSYLLLSTVLSTGVCLVIEFKSNSNKKIINFDILFVTRISLTLIIYIRESLL